MKKTVSINISGIIFHIEEDGYEKLRNYLSGIGRYFSSYEDSQEIISDIEARIAEIFLAKLSPGRQVITNEDVENLIVTMGTISDFEAIADEEPLYARGGTTYTGTATDTKATSAMATEAPRKLYRDLNRKILGGVASGIGHYFNVDPLWIRLLFAGILVADWFFLPGSLSIPTIIAYIILWIVVPGTYTLEEDKKIKKLFRNPDDRVIGGVASGLAAYFGVDITIIRLLFVLSIFFFGAGVLLYFIVWAITPEARTLTEKMKMQGEPVTLSNIEFNVKKSLHEEGNPEESTLVKILLFPFRLIAAVFSGLSKALGPIAVFLLEAIRIGAGILLLIISIAFLFSLLTLLGVGLGWSSGYYDYIQMGDFPVELLRDSIPVAGIIAGFLFLLIPVIFIGHLGLILITKRSIIKAPVGWTLFGIWLLSLIGLSFTVPAFIAQFRTEATYENTREFGIDDRPVYLELVEAGNETYESTSLTLEGHPGNTLKLVQEFEANGRNRQEAQENARMIEYNVSQRDSILSFDENFSFKPGAKFRGQELRMTLYIPYGKEFRMEEDLSRILRNTLHRNGLWEAQLRDNRFVFTPENELKCLTCSDDEVQEDDGAAVNGKRIGLKNFDRIDVGGPFILTVEQSDRYRVVVEGENNDADEVDLDVEGDELTVQYKNRNFPEMLRNRDKIRIYVTMPDLKGLNLAGATKATVKGFDNQDDVEIQLAGAVEADVELNAERVNLNLNGASQLTLRGQANRFDAEITSASKLHAFEFESKEAEVETNSSALAEINVTRNLTAQANSAGRIRYRGQAEVESNTSSAGSIRREE